MAIGSLALRFQPGRAIFFCLLIGLSSAVVAAENRSVDINSGWRFHLGEVPAATNAGFNDSSWRALDLPHDFSSEGDFSPTNASSTGFLPGGVGWYRKAFTLNSAGDGRRILVEFDGVMRNSDVWLNGVHVGHRPYGYISFHYDLTPHLRLGGATNVLVVRCERENVADSRWYPGSGIYRNVRLVMLPPVHIPIWGVFVTTPRVTVNAADVVVNADVRNTLGTNCPARMVVQWLDSAGKLAGEAEQTHTIAAAATFTFTLWRALSEPQLWSPETPALYTAVCRVFLGTQPVDETRTTFGIREARFDAQQGFFLNGVNLKLKGVCVHHDAGALGAAVPVEVWERRLRVMKELGANAVRCSHNPMAPELYALCDRLGLLVLDEAFDEWEIGKRKWVEGRNKGAAQRFGYCVDFKEWAGRDCADMVRRDRNHPSIIAWSLGNEIDYPTDPYVHDVTRAVEGFERDSRAPQMTQLTAVAPKLIAAVKRYDPTRPVTMALANQPATDAIGLAQMLDVVGYNYQEGLYGTVHRAFPGRAILGSENGKGYDAWRAVMDNAYVAGQFLWTGFDFLGEAGEWPLHGSTAGLCDTRGFLKPEGWHRAALWSSRPVLRLAVSRGGSERNSRGMRGVRAHWNWASAGSPVNVTAFSNCEAVELRLNGRVLATQKVRAERLATFSVPFEPGELEAVGCNAGKEVARAKLQTAGAPSQLRVELDRAEAPASKRSAILAIVSVVDERGVLVPESEQLVTVKVSGGGRLLGVDNGDLWDTTPLRSASKRPRGGQLLAVIEANGAGNWKWKLKRLARRQATAW